MQKKLIFSIIILLNLNFIKAPDWAGVTKKIQINPPYGPWVYPPMKFRNKLAILTVIGASASQYYKYQQQKKHEQQKKYDAERKELIKVLAVELEKLKNGPSIK